MTVHDYYLSKAPDQIKNFRDWERENRQKLKSKSDDKKYGEWLEEIFEVPLGANKKRILDKILDEIKEHKDFYPSQVDLNSLPQNSTLFKVTFTLKKPYASKDEGEFHIITDKIFENPIVRDKFLGCPMVRPSTWKGHLRFAAENVEWKENEKRNIIRRLFGSEPEGENILKGRLHFFPTFFKEDGARDVITPLERKTRTPARGPINLEVMKAGTNGEFYLLYLPYPKGNEFKEDDVKADLKLLAVALKLMFYTYGFSAKRTSGFGVIKEKLNDGKIWIKSGANIIEKSFSKLDEVKNKIEELGRFNE